LPRTCSTTAHASALARHAKAGRLLLLLLPWWSCGHRMQNQGCFITSKGTAITAINA